jgi:hypothetical protein
MNRWHVLVMVVAVCATIAAQSALSQNPPYPPSQSSQPYQPAVAPGNIVSPYGSPFGGYGGGGGGTVAGSAMNGMASMMSAAGQRNLNNSAAAINWTQAQKNEIENRQQYTNTYFAMRAENKKARQAEEGPAPTPEQIARMAKQGIPRPLPPTQQDPVSGQLFWPGPLQQECFAAQRGDMDQLLAMQAKYGGLSYEDQMKARKTVLDMFKQLKTQVTQIPPQDYTTARSFLNSVLYSTTKTIL